MYKSIFLFFYKINKKQYIMNDTGKSKKSPNMAIMHHLFGIRSTYRKLIVLGIPL